jgi:hypothetical protein
VLAITPEASPLLAKAGSGSRSGWAACCATTGNHRTPSRSHSSLSSTQLFGVLQSGLVDALAVVSPLSLLPTHRPAILMGSFAGRPFPSGNMTFSQTDPGPSVPLGRNRATPSWLWGYAGIRQVLTGSQSRHCPEAHRRGRLLHSQARCAKNAPESTICGALPNRATTTGSVLWHVPISFRRSALRRVGRSNSRSDALQASAFSLSGASPGPTANRQAHGPRALKSANQTDRATFQILKGLRHSAQRWTAGGQRGGGPTLGNHWSAPLNPDSGWITPIATLAS